MIHFPAKNVIVAYLIKCKKERILYNKKMKQLEMKEAFRKTVKIQYPMLIARMKSLRISLNVIARSIE